MEINEKKTIGRRFFKINFSVHNGVKNDKVRRIEASQFTLA
jgi:hypothetical protein